MINGMYLLTAITQRLLLCCRCQLVNLSQRGYPLSGFYRKANPTQTQGVRRIGMIAVWDWLPGDLDVLVRNVNVDFGSVDSLKISVLQVVQDQSACSDTALLPCSSYCHLVTLFLFWIAAQRINKSSFLSARVPDDLQSWSAPSEADWLFGEADPPHGRGVRPGTKGGNGVAVGEGDAV